MHDHAHAPRHREKASDRGGALARALRRLFQLIVFLLLLGGVSWGLLRGYGWLLQTPLVEIKAIHIRGNHHFEDSRIREMIGIRTGANIIAVHIKKVQETLEDDPWIERALVRRELPHTLHIVITEREPAFWIQKGARIFYADDHGREIGPVQAEGFVSLPYLVFDANSDFQVRTLDALCGHFARRELPFSLAESSWVRFLAGGEIVEFFLQGRQIKIRLNTRDLQVNLDSLRRVWRDLDERRELDGTFRIWICDRLGWVQKEKQV